MLLSVLLLAALLAAVIWWVWFRPAPQPVPTPSPTPPSPGPYSFNAILRGAGGSGSAYAVHVSGVGAETIVPKRGSPVTFQTATAGGGVSTVVANSLVGFSTTVLAYDPSTGNLWLASVPQPINQFFLANQGLSQPVGGTFILTSLTGAGWGPLSG